MPPLRLTLCPHVHNLDLWGINAPFSPIVDGSKMQPVWLGGLECGGCGWSCGWRMSHSCGTSLITQLYLASPAPYLSHSRCPSLSSCSRRFRFLMQCCYINPNAVLLHKPYISPATQTYINSGSAFQRIQAKIYCIEYPFSTIPYLPQYCMSIRSFTTT